MAARSNPGRRGNDMPKKGRLLEFAAFAIGTAVLLAFTYSSFLPTMGRATYREEGTIDQKTSELPMYFPATAKKLNARVTVWMPYFASPVLWINPDDCLLSLSVNGKTLPRGDVYRCTSDKKPPLNLAAYMHPGENNLVLSIEDKGGFTGFDIVPADAPMMLIALCAIWVLAMAWGMRYFLRDFTGVQHWLPTITVFLGGVALRIEYAMTHPFRVLGHDTDAHVDYIMYMLKNHAIPAANAGWEYHQSPLYYGISAAIVRATQWLGGSLGQGFYNLQQFSLLLSILTLGLALWAAAPFLKKRSNVEFALFTGIVAALPSLVFLSSQITNETLYPIPALLCAGFLFRFWHRGKARFWYAACACFAIAYVTKANAYTLVPLMGVASVFVAKISWKKKILHIVAGIALVTALAGWLPYTRLVLERDATKTFTFGNEGMNDDLKLPNDWKYYVVLNPIEVLKKPFNDSWSDASRRQYFWEYFFRSAFYGEYEFKEQAWIAVPLLLFALGLLPLFLYGLFDGLYREAKHGLILFTMFFAILGAGIAYRFAFPFAPNQDFRFSLLLIVPFGIFALSAVRQLPVNLRSGAYTWIAACTVLSTIFLLALSFPATS